MESGVDARDKSCPVCAGVIALFARCSIMSRPAYAPELLLESEAADIAIRWKDFPTHICTRFEHKEIIVELSIRRKGIPVLDLYALTDCQRDILEVLRQVAPDRLTRPKIIHALEHADKIHGESTIAMALAALVKSGHIDPSPRGTRRGYAIKVSDNIS